MRLVYADRMTSRLILYRLYILAQSTSALALLAQRASSLALTLFRPRLRNDLLSSYSGDAGHPPIRGLLDCPPVGGTFWFQIFIQAPSPEIWRKTISDAEGGSGEEVGWPVLGYLLGKNYRRRDRDRLVLPRRTDAAVCRAEVCYPFGRKHGRHRRTRLRAWSRWTAWVATR